MPLWKCTAKLAGLIELKFSGSSMGWIVGLYTKSCHDMTPVANFQVNKGRKEYLRNTYSYCNFRNVDRLCWNFQDHTSGGLLLLKKLLRYDPFGWPCHLTVDPLDHKENLSPIGPASLAVPFQSGNKNTYYVFLFFC